MISKEVVFGFIDVLVGLIVVVVFFGSFCLGVYSIFVRDEVLSIFSILGLLLSQALWKLYKIVILFFRRKVDYEEELYGER